MATPWLPAVLRRIAALAGAGRVRITAKAFDELRELGCTEEDAVDALMRLRTRDFHQRLQSIHTDEGLYVFKPRVAGFTLYVKLVLRSHCVLISFHEDSDDDD